MVLNHDSLFESVLTEVLGSCCLINMCVVRVCGYYKVYFRFIWFSDIKEAAALGHVRYDCIYGLYIVRVASMVDATR